MAVPRRSPPASSAKPSRTHAAAALISGWWRGPGRRDRRGAVVARRGGRTRGCGLVGARRGRAGPLATREGIAQLGVHGQRRRPLRSASGGWRRGGARPHRGAQRARGIAGREGIAQLGPRQPRGGDPRSAAEGIAQLGIEVTRSGQAPAPRPGIHQRNRIELGRLGRRHWRPRRPCGAPPGAPGHHRLQRDRGPRIEQLGRGRFGRGRGLGVGPGPSLSLGVGLGRRLGPFLVRSGLGARLARRGRLVIERGGSPAPKPYQRHASRPCHESHPSTRGAAARVERKGFLHACSLGWGPHRLRGSVRVPVIAAAAATAGETK